MTERLVVIGGDAAGMSCASQARRRRGPEDLSIVVFEATEWISYSACGEPYFVSGEVTDVTSLLARTPEQFEQMAIDVRLHHLVTEIDIESKTVTVDTPNGQLIEPYDQLMYSTGAQATAPDVPGVDLEGVFELHTLNDAVALKAAVNTGTRAVVVGAGYLGLEVAEALTLRGVPTTIIASRSYVMNRSLDPDVGATVTEAIRGYGIPVVESTRLESITGIDGKAVGIETTNGYLKADLVVLGTGVHPRSDMAEAAGIKLGPTGAVEVDDHQRTNVSGVWAAGDCAESHHRLTDQPTNPQLGTVANKQGRVAGMNIGGEDASFPGVLLTSITKVMDTEVARTGLMESEAQSVGIGYVTGKAAGTTTSGYMANAERIEIKVMAEKGTGRLLGAQIVGGPGSGKRIDVLATAIWTGMTGHDFAMSDLSYAPPFSTVWDIVMIAARRAADAATV